MKQLLYGRTSEEVRTICRAHYLRPLVEELFTRAPEVRKLTFAIAQRPSGEIVDAVAHELWIDDDGAMPADLERILLLDECRRARFGDGGSYLDDRGAMVFGFGPCCRPGEPARPFLVAHRTEPRQYWDDGRNFGIRIDEVGQVLRPELVDVPDVGSRRISNDRPAILDAPPPDEYLELELHTLVELDATILELEVILDTIFDDRRAALADLKHLL
jgi:hypothetical protein